MPSAPNPAEPEPASASVDRRSPLVFDDAHVCCNLDELSRLRAELAQSRAALQRILTHVRAHGADLSDLSDLAPWIDQWIDQGIDQKIDPSITDSRDAPG